MKPKLVPLFVTENVTLMSGYKRFAQYNYLLLMVGNTTLYRKILNDYFTVP